MKFIEIGNHILNVDHIMEIAFKEVTLEITKKTFPFVIEFNTISPIYRGYAYYETIELQHDDYTIIFKFLDDTSAENNILSLHEFNHEKVKEKE